MIKKVLIITYYWPPSGGAGVQRWLKFTKYFIEHNYVPTVITVDPSKASYPVVDKSLNEDVDSRVTVHRTSTFEPYTIYKKIFRKKEIPYSGFANESKPTFIQQFTRFIRGNLFIPDARKGWNKYALIKAREVLGKEKFDFIVTTSPPHSTQLIGFHLKKEFNIPWLVDLRDPWTDIYYYKYMNHTFLAKKKDAKLERNILENADKIVVVSESIKEMFISKSDKIDSEKIHVIPNGFDALDFKITDSIKSKGRAEFIITYTGTLSNVYDMSGFIRALEGLKGKVKLRIVGRISKDILNQLDTDLVEVIDHVEHAQSIKYLFASDALLLIIPKIENNEGILTGKLFEYLAARKPIVGLGPNLGDASQIIKECDAGKMLEYSDEIGIKQYLTSLINGDSSVDLTNQNYLNYSRKKLTKDITLILDSINL